MRPLERLEWRRGIGVLEDDIVHEVNNHGIECFTVACDDTQSPRLKRHHQIRRSIDCVMCLAKGCL